MPHFLPYRADASTAETRRIAEHLAAALCGEADGTGLFDAARLWVQGDAWWSGDLDAEKAADIQAKFHKCLKGGFSGLKSEVRSIIADGSKAAIEMALSGPWHDGRHFAKEIHIAIDVQHGRIAAYREYGFDAAFFALESKD